MDPPSDQKGIVTNRLKSLPGALWKACGAGGTGIPPVRVCDRPADAGPTRGRGLHQSIYRTDRIGDPFTKPGRRARP